MLNDKISYTFVCSIRTPPALFSFFLKNQPRFEEGQHSPKRRDSMHQSREQRRNRGPNHGEWRPGNRPPYQLPRNNHRPGRSLRFPQQLGLSQAGVKQNIHPLARRNLSAKSQVRWEYSEQITQPGIWLGHKIKTIPHLSKQITDTCFDT